MSVDREINLRSDSAHTVSIFPGIWSLDSQAVFPQAAKASPAATVQQAQRTLADPSPELMAQLFEVLQIQLHRSEDGTRFEGTGSIPYPKMAGTATIPTHSKLC